MEEHKDRGIDEACSSRDLFKAIPLCRDSEALLTKLQEKVERIEKNADDLYSVIEYISKDEDIITHFAKIEPFPIPTAKGSLRHLVWTLEEQVRLLEGFKGDERPEVNPMFGLKSSSPPPSTPEPNVVPTIEILDDSEPVGMTNIHAYPILRLEVEEMIHELSEWHTTNAEIISTLDQVKGLQHPPNVLCDCLKDVNEMRNRLNLLTGGRYLKRLEIEFFNPRIMKLIEKRLKEAKKFLLELVHMLRNLDQFLRSLMAMKNSFSPYLGKTPILEYFEQPYIGLDRLLETLNIVQDDMQFIDEILSQLLACSEERDERIAYIQKDIEWFHKVKLDKEEVEDILSEKADLKDLDDKINFNVFVRLVNGIAGNLHTSTGELILQEALWSSIMDDMREKLEKKATKSSLKDLEKTISKEVRLLTRKIEDIKSAIQPEEQQKRLQHGKCISCGIEMPFQCNEEKRLATRRTTKLKATLLNVKSELNKKSGTRKRLLKGGSCSKFLQERELYTYKRPYVVDDICKTSLRYCGGSHTVLQPEQRVGRECGDTEFSFEECVEPKECVDKKKKTDGRFIPLTSYDKHPRTCYGYEVTKGSQKSEEEKYTEPKQSPIKPTTTPVSSNQEFVEPSISLIQEFVEPSVSSIQEFVEPSVSSIQEFVEPSVSPIQEFVEPSVSPIQEFVEPSVSPIQESVESPVSSIQKPESPNEDNANLIRQMLFG